MDPPPTGLAHLALTAALVSCVASLAAGAGNLAFAFQIAGSTAGVMVCFVLPGALHVAALRIQMQRGALVAASESAGCAGVCGSSCGSGGGAGGVLVAVRWAVPRSADEAAGAGMVVAGVLSGVVALWATLTAS